MKRYKVLFITTAFLLTGVGTVAASGGPGVQMQNTEAAAENIEGTDDLRQLYNFKFKVGEEELQIPVSYGELVNRGWMMMTTFNEWSDIYQDKQIVKNYQYIYPHFMKGNMVMSTRMLNDQNTDRQLMNLEAAEISFSLSNMKGAIPDIVLPGNIVLGKSTEADIKAAYGEPDDSYIGDGARYAALIYSLSKDQSVSFYHNNDADKVIDYITISNEREQNRKAMEYINSIQPSAVAYVAPSALGSDITRGTYMFEGDVYQYPAPLSAFLDKGWVIESREPAAYFLDPGVETTAQIQRNGITQRVIIANNGTERGPIHNCFTTQVYPDSLPNGIKSESPRRDVLKALEGVDYTYDEQRGLYTFKTADQKYEIEIQVYDYDEKVMHLEICNIQK